MSPWVSEDRLLALEERRFVVLLGILTLFIAYRGNLPRDFPYPLPYPIPHLQIFVLPIFDRFVVVFGVYSVFMFAYFSEDWLPKWFRDLTRRGAWAILTGYWGYFLYISTGLLGSLLVPDSWLPAYGLAFEAGVVLIGLAVVGYVTGGDRLIRGAVGFYSSLLLTGGWLWFVRAAGTGLGKTHFGIHLRQFVSRRLQSLEILRPKLRPYRHKRNL